jgi:tetratricopeptide (TPR) repeat protein
MRPLHPELPGLASRAKRAAARARPATGMKLSLCMIVRDEEEMLPRCLAAAAPAVDEIVIVDTGSRDRTIEIAGSFGARVIEREWTGSFSDARNVSFEHATGDWLLYLDADEVLVGEDVDRLRALTGRTWREAFYLVETSYTGEAGDGTAMTHNALRIFRNRAQYRFVGRLHEQIFQCLPPYGSERIEHTSIRVEHYGYLGTIRDAKEKSRRNIDLLRKQMAEADPHPFLHFNLGSEYAAAGDDAAALEQLERAWAMVRGDVDQLGDWTPTLMVRLSSALRSCRRAEEAIERAQEGLDLFPLFTDLVFSQALAARQLGRKDEAIAYYRRCIEMGDAPAAYGSTLGCGTYLPRIALAELHLERGALDAARELLDWCIAEHPHFVGVARPYATALLAGGAAPEAVVQEIEQRMPVLTPTVRFALATALVRHGAINEAERQYREVLASRPTSTPVRMQLMEALLQQRRYADAAAEAGAVADDDPFAPLASRIEVWGQIAAGNLDLARAARLRASKLGVPAPELELFEAWAALAAGEEIRRVPVAGAPLLGAILETLLRIRDLETFERLLPLFEHSALPRREQHETLGNMYLRNGYLTPAAKQWMAVCDDRTDARALVGLARVAAAHGQAQGAATFAAEALRLDPANAGARALLAQLPPAATTPTATAA